VEDVELGHRLLQPIDGWDGDVDLRRVDVAELVQVERGVVGEHAPAICPHRRLGQLSQLWPGIEQGEAVEAPGHALDRAAALHVDQPVGINAGLTGIGGGEEPLLFGGDQGKLVVISAWHLIKELRFATK
jgi:hypothetical protein